MPCLFLTTTFAFLFFWLSFIRELSSGKPFFQRKKKKKKSSPLFTAPELSIKGLTTTSATPLVPIIVLCALSILWILEGSSARITFPATATAITTAITTASTTTTTITGTPTTLLTPATLQIPSTTTSVLLQTIGDSLSCY